MNKSKSILKRIYEDTFFLSINTIFLEVNVSETNFKTFVKMLVVHGEDIIKDLN